MNGWTETQALSHLRIKLKGAAIKFYHTLPVEHQRDYTEVMDAMAKRFAAVHSATTARYKLEQLRQKKNQTLEELAQEAHQLSHAAYDVLRSPDHVEREGVRAFLRALHDTKLADNLVTKDIATLRDALDTANKYKDAFHDLHANKTSKFVKQAAEIASLPADADEDTILNKLRNFTTNDTPGRNDRRGNNQNRPNQQQRNQGYNQNQGNNQNQFNNQNNPGRNQGNQGNSGNTGGQGTRTRNNAKPGRPCLICNQEGHWATDCTYHPNNWDSATWDFYKQRGNAPSEQGNNAPQQQNTQFTQWPANQIFALPVQQVAATPPSAQGNNNGQGNAKSNAGGKGRGRGRGRGNGNRNGNASNNPGGNTAAANNDGTSTQNSNSGGGQGASAQSTSKGNSGNQSRQTQVKNVTTSGNDDNSGNA